MRTDIDAAEANFLDAWRLLASEAPGGVVEETDELLFTGIALPIAYFNSAFVKAPADPAACLDAARRFFDTHGTPYTLRYRDDDSSQTEAACLAAGLDAAGSMPLMVAAVADIAAPAVPVLPVDSGSWDDHLDTIAAGFAMDRAVLDGVIAPGLGERDEYQGFLAYDGSTPASTAALIVTDDIAGVYNVATPEAFRRRGLGQATTAAAVAAGAARGCAVTTLQASDMGYPIYERMGYRTVVRWRNFIGE